MYANSQNNQRTKNNVKKGFKNYFKDTLLDFKFNNKSIKIEQLHDYNIDNLVQNGINNRWIIVFYLSTCGHCRRARTVLRNLLKDNENNVTYQNIKYGEIDIDQNTVSSLRFNADGVPYIILVDNNTLYELNVFPNRDNLQNFIFTDIKQIDKKDLKIYPKKLSFFKISIKMGINILKGINKRINEILKEKGFKYELPIWGMVLLMLGLIVSGFYLEYIFLSRCCFQDDFEKEMKLFEKNLKEKERFEKEEEVEAEEEEGEGEEEAEGKEDNDGKEYNNNNMEERKDNYNEDINEEEVRKMQEYIKETNYKKRNQGQNEQDSEYIKNDNNNQRKFDNENNQNKNKKSKKKKIE